MKKLLCLLLLLTAANALADFRFVQITDSHGGRYEQGNKALAGIVREVAALEPKPAFVIVSGDLVETGLDWEYERYLAEIKPLAEAGIPVYHVPGNHESRWAARGKQDFIKRLGPTYSHFVYQGQHFLLLDTSFVPEAYGHIESAQLQWLDARLAQIGPDAPLWVFSHHPLGFSVRYTDNEWEAIERLLPANLVLAMSGHGHSWRRWQIQGREFSMTRAAMLGEYAIVDVTADKAAVFRKQLGQAARLDFEVPVRKTQKTAVSFIVSQPEQIRQSEAFALTVTSSIPLDSVQVKLGGVWKALEGSGNFWSGSIVTAYAGTQTLFVRGHKGSELYQEQRTVAVLPSKETSLPRVLWTYKTGGSIFSSPAADERNVYFGSHDGKMYALEKLTGTLSWSFPTAGPILSSPLLWEGGVYFGSQDGKIYAVAAASGAELWSRDVGEPITASPAISQGKLYLGGPAFLYCLDAATGKLVWQSEDGNLIKVKPAIADGKVYFTSWGGLVTCLAADTGALIWQKQIDSSFYYAPATGDPLVASGKLIITTPRNRVIALDLLTGEKLWQAESVKAGFCSPALWQDRILVASLDGKVYALDGETGQTIWSGSAGESIYDAKIAADGQVGVTNTCWGSLAAFDLGTGERKWKLKLADAFIFSAPVVSEGVAYVGSTNDHLYAVQYK